MLLTREVALAGRELSKPRKHRYKKLGYLLDLQRPLLHVRSRAMHQRVECAETPSDKMQWRLFVVHD